MGNPSLKNIPLPNEVSTPTGAIVTTPLTLAQRVIVYAHVLRVLSSYIEGDTFDIEEMGIWPREADNNALYDLKYSMNNWEFTEDEINYGIQLWNWLTELN